MNAETLYKTLKIKILNGELRCGDHLGETTIARQYDTSRLYAKSALQKLEEECLAKRTPNRGYHVLEIPDNIFEEISDIQEALEGVIVKRVIHVATEEELTALSKILNRIDVFIRNNMIDDGLSELENFYDLLYRISRYSRVVSILETYSDYISILRKRSASTYEEHLISLENTHMLFNAIAARDENAAMGYLKKRPTFYHNI